MLRVLGHLGIRRVQKEGVRGHRPQRVREPVALVVGLLLRVQKVLVDLLHVPVFVPLGYELLLLILVVELFVLVYELLLELVFELYLYVIERENVRDVLSVRIHQIVLYEVAHELRIGGHPRGPRGFLLQKVVAVVLVDSGLRKKVGIVSGVHAAVDAVEVLSPGLLARGDCGEVIVSFRVHVAGGRSRLGPPIVLVLFEKLRLEGVYGGVERRHHVVPGDAHLLRVLRVSLLVAEKVHVFADFVLAESVVFVYVSFPVAFLLFDLVLHQIHRGVLREHLGLHERVDEHRERALIGISVVHVGIAYIQKIRVKVPFVDGHGLRHHVRILAYLGLVEVLGLGYVHLRYDQLHVLVVDRGHVASGEHGRAGEDAREGRRRGDRAYEGFVHAFKVHTFHSAKICTIALQL